MTETSGHAPPAIYRAIAAVAGAIAKQGIAKSNRNSQQGYNFRGIDDVYNALAPILSDAGLVVLPRVLNRIETERETKSGGALFNVVVEVEFDFVAAEDGSRHIVKTFGEAMDSADKATNKAMSAAYKYAAMQAFCIPTAGDNDADATTHDIAPRRQNTASQAPARRGAPTRQAPVRQAAAASQAPMRPSVQASQPHPVPPSQPPASQAPAQPQPTSHPLPGPVATTAAAIKACQEAGLTELGIAAMCNEMSRGQTGAIAGLSLGIQQRLATNSVSTPSVAKWNAAGAAAASNDAAEADDDPDLPRTWDGPAAA
jgi:hypothetical protein